ncbi:MAG: MMPL family transporter [Myxococcaceae bacterium]|nr:MMPL family transporter [Myxococcaceae bacterium]
MSHKNSLLTRTLERYARLVTRHPGLVLLTLIVLGIASAFLASRLRIESDQLKLISQDLQEVKDVNRVVDMVGGAGHLMLALRSNDEATLKRVADGIYEDVLAPDKEHVRNVTYKVPVDFVQKNMVLFIDTEDLAEAKRRINAYLKDQIRRNNPFFIEIRKTEPVKLDLQDLIDKYSKVGDKSIRDDYYISDDRQMMMMLIKPMWNTTELERTREFIEQLRQKLTAWGRTHGLEELAEDYDKMGDAKHVYYGFTGSYKTIVDDSYAIDESLSKVWGIALGGIVLVALIFFRKLAPSFITISGMALGTLLTLGFAKVTLGELNMVTSMIGAILMGFGIDYGIHFIYRTRIELGLGKNYQQAIYDALVYAGRPALVAAVVTSGSFFVLLVSGFRGFSQFGLLAGFGTLILGVSIFSWCSSILLLIGRRWPGAPKRLIGEMKLPPSDSKGGNLRIPRPGLVLAATGAVVLGACAFAIPWAGTDLPKNRPATLLEKLKSGVNFDYNTRSLLPEDAPGVKLQDEINRRFGIASDPVAVYTKDLAEAKELFDELTVHKEKYPSVRQVVSIYSFVPPKKTAEANAKILAEWQEELKDIDITALPPEMQEKAALFKEILARRPFEVEDVPQIYADIFKNLPTSKNKGYLTFLYPGVDVWDGKNLLKFANETAVITAASGHQYRSAGLATLYAKLARIVLFDGKLTVVLAALWILVMHYLDFRSVPLALASVIPLCVGLLMMLGIMSLVGHSLNFMNMIILPILLGFGVSHGLYLLHRFLEGTSPVVAFRSVGAAVAASTLTAITGFASLLYASHKGLQSVGFVACLGLTTTLVVSFTVLAPVLQLIHDGRMKKPRDEDKVSADLETRSAA